MMASATNEEMGASQDVQVISLNALKRGTDNAYHRLEIPVALAKPQRQQAKQFCSVRVEPLAMNSNCQLELSYAFGATQVIASLQGPSEAKFGSKADYSRAFIEVNLKVGAPTDTGSNEGTVRVKQEV